MFNIYKHKSNITMVNYAGCDNQLKQTRRKLYFQWLNVKTADSLIQIWVSQNKKEQ